MIRTRQSAHRMANSETGDMTFKKSTVPTTVPENPDRLFRDLPRRKHASLSDHQGLILRAYVAKVLKALGVALQLPTGSGKTLVL